MPEPPHPLPATTTTTTESMLFIVKEDWRLNNIDFGGRGLGYTGGGDRNAHHAKRGPFKEVSQDLSLIVAIV